jgi:hypothetical protein
VVGDERGLWHIRDFQRVDTDVFEYGEVGFVVLWLRVTLEGEDYVGFRDL